MNEWSPTSQVIKKFHRDDKKNDNTLKQSHNTIVLCFYGMIPYFLIFYDTMFFLYEDSHKMRLIH